MTWLASESRYDKMPYRRCGRSGIDLPLISLGLWYNFGIPDDPTRARDMILHSFDSGITCFDIANTYGPPSGGAETTLGKLLKTDLAPYRDEMIITTKAGYRCYPGPYGEWGSRKYLLASLDRSLRNLGTDYVDIFYSHRPDPSTPLEETMGALHQAVHSGKALYAGISSYDAVTTLRASRILRDMGTPCLVHQPMYSMFARWIERDLLEVLDAEGIGCAVFSSLEQGLLTDKYLKGIPPDSRVTREDYGFFRASHITPDKIEKVRQLNEVAKGRGQSMAQLALAWAMRRKTVTSVIIGASSIAQIDDCIGATRNVSFSDDELARIEGILKGPAS